MKQMQKIVVKVGTSTLTQGTKKLSRRCMLGLAEQIAVLHGQGKEVVLVSSGAIAAGREVLNFPKLDPSLPSKQMFASVGQVKLMQEWSDLFSLFEIPVGQILLTKDDFSHRERHLNARDTLNCLLKQRVLPIINENDTVATKEIRVGDNDNLASMAAHLIGADALILLTDQEGLFTADPRLDKDAKLIPIVKKIDEAILAIAGGSTTTLGTGGMTTKIEAAGFAAAGGIRTIIAPSYRPRVLIELAAGEKIGTCFLEEISARESRKRRLLSEKHLGTIYVDAGAAASISIAGASLLPSGVSWIDQTFERGAVVQIAAPGGEPIAIGITAYGSHEIDPIKGKQSSEIEKILGYSYGAEIVHRTNMTRVKS